MTTWSEHGSGHFHLEVGLSGGIDSVVLLHALLALRAARQLPWQITAVHVNHQLQAVALEWVEFCQQLCATWQVPLRVATVEVIGQQTLGLEAAAREARYRVYRDSQADAVVLAHHADDQIETALLAWLRGGGIRALAAMPAWRNLAAGIELWRPLLPVSKVEIADYAAQHQLAYVNDPSNHDTALQRNWLRQQVLPTLLQRPETRTKIVAGIAQVQNELALLDEVRQQDRMTIYQPNKVFNIMSWLLLSPARRAQQLLLLANEQGLGGWKKSQLAGFAAEIAAKPRSRHHVKLPFGEIFADKGRLYPWNEALRQPFVHLPWHAKVAIGKNKESYPDGLAMTDGLVNTQTSLPRQLCAFAQLRQLSPQSLPSVLKRMQQTKIPFFVQEYWPCWLDLHTGQVWLAAVDDGWLGSEQSYWHDKLAFLRHYLVKAASPTGQHI